MDRSTRIQQLKDNINNTLDLIDSTMANAKVEADAHGADIASLRSADGKYIVYELLSARIRAYHSLAILESLEDSD